MECKNCGKEMLDDSKLCLNCGNEKYSSEKQENQVNTEFVKELKKGRIKYLILLVLLIIAEYLLNTIDKEASFYFLLVLGHIVLLIFFILSFIETLALANIIPTWLFVALVLVIYFIKIPYLLIGSIAALDIAIQLKKYFLSRKKRA